MTEAKKIISTAREYILAMSMELERRALPTDTPENLKRSLELSAYFTIPKLEVAHRQLALMAAMKFAYTNQNFSSALSFANRMIANGGSAKLLDQVSPFFIPSLYLLLTSKQAKKIKAQCERNPQDAIEIEFDQFAEFDICAASHTPIYGGSPSVTCPYTGTKYHEQHKGSVCTVCKVSAVGAPASGLRLFVPGQH